MENNQVDRRIWLGIGAIILGLVFLANNFGIIDYEIRRYIFRWEMVLIVIGLFFILGPSGRRSTGIILLAIGGIFLLRDFMQFHFSFWQVFWPSLLILAGVMVLFRHRIDRDWKKKPDARYDHMIDEMVFFGGGDRSVNSQQFEGGRVTTIFGGMNYNLLKAKLAPGDNYLDVFCLFGGIKLVIPDNWNVKIDVLPIFGGFGDKQRYKSPEAASEGNSRLIIKGTVIFGGGEIKNHLD